MTSKIERNPRRPIYPTPAGLVVSVDATGKPNIITLGEIFNLSIGNPVWVGIAIAERRYSHDLVRNRESLRSICRQPKWSKRC